MDDPFFTTITRRGLAEGDRAVLAGAYRNIIHVDAQADLVNPRDGGKQLHILLKGWACKYRLLADGRRQLLRIHLPGEICDLDAICGVPPATVLALTECRCATLPLDGVRTLAGERPAIRNLLWSLTAEENAVMVEHLVSLGRRTARERTAFFLCDILQRLEGLGDVPGNRFRLPMTQVDMGDYLGLSTVHINRTLQNLKTARVIQHSGRTFTVCSRDELERFAGYPGGRTRAGDPTSSHP